MAAHRGHRRSSGLHDEAAHENDFIQYLLDFDPEMATTSEAVEAEAPSTNEVEEEEESPMADDGENHQSDAAAE